MTEIKETKIELGDKVVGQIELPKIDLSEHIGKKINLEKVEEHEGNFGFYIKVITETLGNIETADGEKPLKASRIFGLQENAEGQLGWGEKTKLGLFLKKMGVNNYKDLVGKEVIVQSITNNDGKEYLTFN